jgi:hypothetical protein
MSGGSPVVRLIPSSLNSSAKAALFCVQSFSFSEDRNWENLGIARISNDSLAWKPEKRFLEAIPDINVSFQDFAENVENRNEPYFNVRFRIRRLVDSVFRGELPFDKILPLGFAGSDRGEKPVFE